MTYTAEGFNQFCHDAAGQFLQSVVVIDNEAVFCEVACKMAEQKVIETELHAPPVGVLGGQLEPIPDDKAGNDTPALVAPPEEPQRNILRVKPLVDAFADKGAVCSILRPEPGETTVVERAIALAAVADIVVVDWALGKMPDESSDTRAKQIIRGIIERDLERRGRLRLIAIYTAEGNPATILDALYEHIKDLDLDDSINKDDASFTIQNRLLKIVVLLKPAAGEHVPGSQPVEFAALPDRLHELFAELNRGLLPSITLQSIAAIREGTHHLLAVLHKDLDPALVGHRCLLPHPEDAEEFCEDLVAGEIRSILALSKIGAKYAGKEQNKLWVASRLNGDGTLNFGEFRATHEQVSTLLSVGIDAFKPFKSDVKQEWSDRTGIRKQNAPTLEDSLIPQFLHGEETGGENINHEFSRLASFKREAFGLRQPIKAWEPRLTLGTILQRVKDGKIFLCLQPRCESVRLDKNEKRIFPFLEMGIGAKSECLVVNTISADNTPEEKKLFFEPKPKNQAVFEFKSTSGNVVTAKKNNDLYVFSATRNKFYWLGDLKDPLAQNFAGKVSDAVGSVGINPYEWQRKQGSNKN